VKVIEGKEWTLYRYPHQV